MNQARRKTLNALDLYDFHEALRSAHETARSALERDDKVTPSVVLEICQQVHRVANEAGIADNASGIVQAEAEAEQEGFDNLSEGLQQTERGRTMEEAAGCLQEATDSLYQIVVDIAEAEKLCDELLEITDVTPIDEETDTFAWDECQEEHARNLVENMLSLLSSAEADALTAAEQVDQAVAC